MGSTVNKRKNRDIIDFTSAARDDADLAHLGIFKGVIEGYGISGSPDLQTRGH